MDVNTKAFWQKVKDEYKVGTSYSICSSSITFRDAWKFNLRSKETIRELAEHFLISCKEVRKVELGFSWLFECHSFDYGVKIRKDFIDWCIQKFS